MYKAAIRALAQANGLNRLLTLTLDKTKIPPGEDPVRYIRKAFAEFRVYLHRRAQGTGQKLKYICVLEFHGGGGPNHGMPHLHILLDQYIEQAWISSVWQAIGGGHRVDIRFVGIKHASRYLSKYLTKDLLLSAPAKTRRVTTSREIKLIQKRLGPKHYAWQLRQLPIEHFYDMYSSSDMPQKGLFQIVDVCFDSEQQLQSFAVPVA